MAQFQEASNDFDSFISTFVRLSPGKNISEEDFNKAQASRANRLAKLYSEERDEQKAMGWANQGRELDPTDSELDQMKKENLEQPHQSRDGDSPEGDEEDFPWWGPIVLIVSGLAIMSVGAFFR